MDALSSTNKRYRGQWLARNRLDRSARAYVAADLVTGEFQLVEPTQLQAAFLARVNASYVHWALARPRERGLICAGVEPLVPPSPPVSAAAMESAGPLLTDSELLAVARANGAERLFCAIELLL